MNPIRIGFSKMDFNLFLLEITCGNLDLWEIWIQLNEEEIHLYEKEGNIGLEKISRLFSSNCHNTDYQRRYIIVNQ